MITLGYLVADFITEFLPSPADPSRPFTLTDEQAAFLLRWYEVDEAGQFFYRRGVMQEAKGRGKSPLCAAIAIAEFCGPVLFDGLNAAGQPVGRPWGTRGAPPSYVQVSATSESQATANVYSLIWEWLSVNDGRAARDLGVDEGKTRLYLAGHPGSKLEAVTSASGSREGQRVTFGVLDESHLMTPENGGTKLARTVRRNAGKMGGRTLESCNAPELGRSSVAEETAAAATKGEAGILFAGKRPAVVPSPDQSDADLLAVLTDLYRGSPWVDPSRILAEVRDSASPWSDSLRYYFNIAAAGLAALVDPGRWSELRGDKGPERGSRISLGFVGTGPAAALVACSEAGSLRTVDVWEAGEGRVSRVDVEEAIRETFKSYDVTRMYCDPQGWRSEVEGWADKYGEKIVVEIPATASPRRFAPILDRFRAAVEEGQLHHDGDPDLARHMANARLRESRSGYVLEPAGPGLPIAGAVAAALSFEAKADAPKKRESAYAHRGLLVVGGDPEPGHPVRVPGGRSWSVP